MNSVSIDKAVIEQAEQEPVFYNPSPTCARHIEGVPVGTRITAPVRTKDLTDDEIAAVYEQDEHHHGEFNYRFDPVSFARAIIAAYKAKQNQ